MLINISQNIRNNRVARKWSQEYLAEKLGVSFQAVSKCSCTVKKQATENNR